MDEMGTHTTVIRRAGYDWKTTGKHDSVRELFVDIARRP